MHKVVGGEDAGVLRALVVHDHVPRGVHVHVTRLTQQLLDVHLDDKVKTQSLHLNTSRSSHTERERETERAFLNVHLDDKDPINAPEQESIKSQERERENMHVSERGF